MGDTRQFMEDMTEQGKMTLSYNVNGAAGVTTSPGNVPLPVKQGLALTRWDALLLLLRLMVIAFTVASLLLLVMDTQTVRVHFGPFTVAKLSKYSDVHVFRGMVYTEGAVAGIMLLQLLLEPCLKIVRTSTLHWTVFFLDQAATYVLLTVAAACGEVAWIAKKGEEKLLWEPICPMLNHFCGQVGKGLALATIALFLLAIICLLSAFRPRYYVLPDRLPSAFPK